MTRHYSWETLANKYSSDKAETTNQRLIRHSALLQCALPLAGRASAATVVSIGDCYTLRVVDSGQKVTIRLACIDAPEPAQAP